MRVRTAASVLCLLVFAGRAESQAVSISPTSGTTSTHFILSSAGWPKCPGTSCSQSLSVSIEGHIIYNQTGVDPFSIDLSTIDPPDHICAICALTNGQHTIRLQGFTNAAAVAAALFSRSFVSPSQS
jgi:hypothetical protein